jgi:hypothetical protein
VERRREEVEREVEALSSFVVVMHLQFLNKGMKRRAQKMEERRGEEREARRTLSLRDWRWEGGQRETDIPITATCCDRGHSFIIHSLRIT